jgi:hypothetical protein
MVKDCLDEDDDEAIGAVWKFGLLLIRRMELLSETFKLESIVFKLPLGAVGLVDKGACLYPAKPAKLKGLSKDVRLRLTGIESPLEPAL